MSGITEHVQDLMRAIVVKRSEVSYLQEQLQTVRRMCPHENVQTTSGPDCDGEGVVYYHTCPDCLKEWET